MTWGSSISTGVAASSGEWSGVVPKTRREGPMLAALYPPPAALPDRRQEREPRGIEQWWTPRSLQ
jgi:hypothetical protein